MRHRADGPESCRVCRLCSKHAGEPFQSLHMICVPSVTFDPFCSIQRSQLGHLSRSGDISNFLIGPVSLMLVCHLTFVTEKLYLKAFLVNPSRVTRFWPIETETRVQRIYVICKNHINRHKNYRRVYFILLAANFPVVEALHTCRWCI